MTFLQKGRQRENVHDNNRERRNGRKEGRKKGTNERCMEGLIEDGWMEGWMDGWMDGGGKKEGERLTFSELEVMVGLLPPRSPGSRLPLKRVIFQSRVHSSGLGDPTKRSSCC